MKNRTMHRQYRSPMGAVLDIIAEGGKARKEPWGLKDILKNKRVEERAAVKNERAEQIIEAAKARLQKTVSDRRVTVIKRVKAGYHATGIGEILSTSMEQIKETARNAGYTHLRIGKSNRFVATTVAAK